MISAKGVFEIAQALHLDGHTGPSIVAMSSLSDSNWACGMDALTRRSVPIFEQLPFYTFDVPVGDRRGRGISKVQQDIVLPHEAFAALYTHHRTRFHELMATDSVAEFWSHQPLDRLQQLHGGWQADRAKRIVPLRIFGDDAAVCSTINCNVVLLCSSTGFRLNPLLSRIPLCITPMKFADGATFRKVYTVILWSLRCLAEGTWPRCDPWGDEWPLGSWRRQRADSGLPLAGPWTGMFFESGGDWKWAWQTFDLPWYYGASEICQKCHASKTGACSFLNLAPHAPRRVPRTDAQYVQHLADHDRRRPPLAQFAGFTVQESILLDWMHNNWLGATPIAAGGALLELVHCGCFGSCAGPRITRLQVCLKRAWLDFCEWCKSEGLEHSQQCFTPASLSSTKATDWALLKCKAHNGSVVCKWLACFTSRQDQREKTIRLMSHVFRCLSETDRVFSAGPFWLDDHHASILQECKDTLLRAWKALAMDAASRGLARWNAIPKLHMMEHTYDEAITTRRNPGGYWNMSDESMMGNAKKAAGRFFGPQLGRRILFNMVVLWGLELERL